ncbi:MAG: hypothetical protein DRO89_00580 [Candidatus Altiarchaeales archaeon]|nr:MAG: hypothetical protein DRO89_00580 [Candidatus Altiarchaeales archaeon]
MPLINSLIEKMKIDKILILGLIFIFLFSISVNAVDTDDWMICAKYPNLDVLCGEDNVTLPEKPPVDFIISGAEYRGVVKEKSASITAIYDLEVLKDGWVEIPLLSSDVAIANAKLDGKRISLLTKNGKHELITNEIGKHKLEIDFLVKVYSDVDSNNLKFNIPRTSVSKVWFEIPKTNISVSIASSFSAEITESNGKTYASAVLTSTDLLSMRWSRKIEIPEPEILEPRIYAEVFTLMSIGEGIINGDTTVQYSIVQAGTAHFTVSLPTDVDVLDVTGSRLKDWRVKEDKGRKILDVYLSSEIKGTYQLSVKYEKTLQGTSAVSEIPRIQILGVEREKGYIGIEARTNVEITVTDVSGANRIDVKELPYPIVSRTKRPILLAYKYLKHPYTIILDIKKHEEIPVLSAVIDSASFITLVVGDGKSITKGTYYVKNNRKQFLELDLPPNSRVWSTFVSGGPVKPAKSKKGTILIPLSKSMGGESRVSFPVEIVYITEMPGMGYLGTSDFVLPRVDIPISRADLILYLPEEHDFLRFDGNMKEVKERRHYIPEIPAPTALGGAPSNAMLESQVKEVEEFRGAVQKAAEKGVLPVQVSVPQQGKVYRFSKLMVTEDQRPWVQTIYINSEIYSWFNLIVFLAVLITVLKAMKRLTMVVNIWDWIGRKKSLIILIVILAFIAKYTLPSTFNSALIAAVIALLLGSVYLGYKKISRMGRARRGRRSTESRLKEEIMNEK